MARSVLGVSTLGEHVCWLLVNQAMGIPDAKMPSNFMQDRVALLLFTRNSLPERLCATAAVRQMGGTTIYQGAQEGGQDCQWRQEMDSMQMHLAPILGYYLDCVYIYGYPTIRGEVGGVLPPFPVINCGSPSCHPIHALADIACMMKTAKKLDGVKAAWVGAANGTLHSLMEATAFFPYRLSISVPPDEDMSEYKARAGELGTEVSFVDTPEQAVAGAQFVFAGRRSASFTGRWAITPQLMAQASLGAKLLLSATPIRAVPIAPEVMDSKVSLLVRQAQYRLCVHKRVLHWVFEKTG